MLRSFQAVDDGGMNLLDQSVIKKGKNAAAPRDAAPGRAPHPAPALGAPPRRVPPPPPPPGTAAPRGRSRREGLAAVPAEAENESGGSRLATASVRPSARRPAGFPRAVPAPPLLPGTGNRGARDTGGHGYRGAPGASEGLRGKPRGCPGGARRQLPPLPVQPPRAGALSPAAGEAARAAHRLGRGKRWATAERARSAGLVPGSGGDGGERF